ncbi:TetR/AcrR family transcriptional regulator [Kineobactrum salinum]|uniref:TetR/AcrR family transcriptional regulator n=1 Tax=Kineobactrum salinum TaxID=2708301 RepID=A0A6C0U7L5_9GAMM|nr:TetR/AcrR family transcriptional regulator [Kineobactrum salinum]QIB67329.1 TetR/AcrR family transcriptional regulator [Kineobactrum salinum]
MASPNDSKAGSYHHGDLRNALIVAAAELIEESGSTDFAMIDAARRAGVSSAAPYRHFRDKNSLLDAVAELGFLGLTEAGNAATAGQPQGSAEAIIALGKAYIGFVTSHPQFYSLMWGDMSWREVPAEQEKQSGSCFYALADAVGAWCRANGRDDEDVLQLSIKLWALAHGLSSIAMHGHVDYFLPQADAYALLESSTHTFLEGVRRGA